jgi:UDPglucose 6-dehydrogenase
LCRWLVAEGAKVCVHDPSIRQLPGELRGTVDLAESPVAAVRGASALIVATPWPEYRNVDATDVAPLMTRPLVLDAGGFTQDTLGRHPAIEYLTVGKAVA